MRKLVVILGVVVIVAMGMVKQSLGGNKVTRIIDGDTIEVSGYDRHIRLIGVDTAETGECYRAESTAETTRLLLDKQVKIKTDENEMDNFGRVLAYVFLPDETMVNKKLLETGTGQFFYDSVNLKYQSEFILAAEAARMARVGFWQSCGPCEVKGNYDIHGKRYYHLPSFRHYSQVVVNMDKADRWFCSEEDAIKAGFVRARE